MKKKILEILKNNKCEFISGEAISNKLGVSRAAIWKYMKALKEEGYEIESVSRKGYRIVENADILTYEEVKPYLNTNFIGRKIVHFETIDSTNIKAREIANLEDEGTLIISEEQTLGRGRLGREWVSPKGKGVWMSLILKPDLSPEKVARITLIGAAAVYIALEEMEFNAKIKWPNDLLLDNKKLCGILTEMNAELNYINYIIMGIGINVNLDKEDYTEELREIATSLKIQSGEKVSRKELVGRVLNNFEKLYLDFIEKDDISESINICRKNSILIDKEVNLIHRGKIKPAIVKDIDENGELIVINEEGKEEVVISGEVSVKGIYGCK